MLIENQPMKPPTVESCRNQLNTSSALDEMPIRDKKAKALEQSTATIGKPFFVHLVRIWGACLRIAKPKRMREEQKRNEFPAENALVNMPAVTIVGNAFMFAFCIAITNGDCVAVPVDGEDAVNRFSSVDDTMSPATKTPRM